MTQILSQTVTKHCADSLIELWLTSIAMFSIIHVYLYWYIKTFNYRALGGSSNLRIPGFPVGSCLSEYVPDVTLLLKNKVICSMC